jgi:short-subunit dehydrogenase
VTNIVITGCSTGIGLETANYLKDKFIKVYPTARDQKDVDMLKGLGFEHAMQLDVTKPEMITAVIEKVLELDGHIDVWFNNAGYGQPGAMEDITTDTLREQFETNVFGLHECTRQIIPLMREQGHGKIIQHSSVLGLISLFSRGSYNASKYAIEGLTDTLRLELEDTNIYPVLLNTGPITSHFRQTALKKLKENVDIEHSVFKEKYLSSLQGTQKKVPFNEEASSVASVVHKITGR